MDFNNLVGKIIRFNKLVEYHEIGFDENMIAKVISVEPDHEYGCDGVIKIIVDHSTFIDNNRRLMKPNYYDKNGVPCLTWEESGLMKLKETIYVDVDTKTYPLPFDVLDEVPVTIDECLDILKMIQDTGNIIMEKPIDSTWLSETFKKNFSEADRKARLILQKAHRI